MPKIRLTKEAAKMSVDKYLEIMKDNNKSDTDLISSMNHNIEMMKLTNDMLISGNIGSRERKIEDILKNDNIINKEDEIMKLDSDFHQGKFEDGHDHTFSDYASNLLVMAISLNKLKAIGKNKELDDRFYEESKKHIGDIFKIDSNQLDTFIEKFSKANDLENDLNDFYQELDAQKLDNYDDIVEKVNNDKKIEEENKRIENEKLQQIKAYNDETLEIESFVNKTVTSDTLNVSESFFKDNYKEKENSKDYVSDVLNEIKGYRQATKNAKKTVDNSDEISLTDKRNYAKCAADEKKMYIGGYLKIKEHFDNKNIFIKLFTLKESINEYKALKQLKNKIHEKYGTDPEELERLEKNHVNSKLNNKDGNEIKEENKNINRVQSKDLENKLLNSMNKNINNDKTVVNTTELNKNKDLNK